MTAAAPRSPGHRRTRPGLLERFVWTRPFSALAMALAVALHLMVLLVLIAPVLPPLPPTRTERAEAARRQAAEPEGGFTLVEIAAPAPPSPAPPPAARAPEPAPQPPP
ncbi:hypothetical protein ACFO3Q_07345, partial [Coralloluteibacterium thermophilus]